LCRKNIDLYIQNYKLNNTKEDLKLYKYIVPCSLSLSLSLSLDNKSNVQVYDNEYKII